MITKAWKLFTPSLSTKNRSVYWDWSNKCDGTRIMEVFFSDLTGEKSYIIIRITRDTELDCDDEFEGQMTDGYFENYRGDIKGKEVSPDRYPRVGMVSRHLMKRFVEDVIRDITVNTEFLNSYDNTEALYTFAAVLRLLKLDVKSFTDKLRKVEDCRRVNDGAEFGHQEHDEAMAELNQTLTKMVQAAERELDDEAEPKDRKE